MKNIIDAHSHFMPTEVARNTAFFKVHWSDLGRQLATMDELGIEKSLLLYPTSDAHLNMGGWSSLCKIYNAEIAAVVRRYPQRFIGAGILPVDQPEAIPAELVRIQDSGLKVISLASSYEKKYLDDPIFEPVYEFAKQKRFPIHVHPQIMNPIGEERVRDPLLSPVLEYVFDVSICIGKMMMGGVFSRFPEVSFIFAHYGGVLPIVKERFDNTYQMLHKRNLVKDLTRNPGEFFQNLYFDTSGSRSPASLLCALELTNPAHVLFGSDYPANQNLSAGISVVENSTLSLAEKEGILGNNILNLLN